MSTVEVETGRYVKRFAFWNPATWSIPKLYWDAWSQEQRLHAICRQLEKVIGYADYLGVNVDDIAARLKAIEEGQLDPIIEATVETWFEEHEPEVFASIQALNEALPIEDFDSENTVKKAFDNVGEALDDVNETMDSLESEIDGIKEKKFAAISFDKLEPFARSSVEFGGVRYSPQGGTSFVNTAGNIISAAFLAPVGDNTQNGYLRTMKNNTVVSELNVHLGHGNSMCYHDGYIYIPDNSVNNVVYKFAITQNGDIGPKEAAWNSPGGNVCCTPDGRFFMVNYNFIIEIDPETGTELMRVNNPQFHVLDSAFHTTTQSIGCFVLDDEIYFAYVTARPNLVSIVNIEGKFITQKSLPIASQYIMLAEVENITIDGSTGDFYVQSPDNAGTYQTKSVVFFKGNIWDKSIDPGKVFRSGNGQVTCQLVQDTDYVFPRTDNEGEPSADNPVKVYYAQDLSTMIQMVDSQSLSIELTADNTRKNGIMLGTGFAELFDMNFTSYTCEFRSCQVMIIGSTLLNDTKTNNENDRPNVRVINNAFLTVYNTWTNAHALYSNHGIICCSQTVDDSLVPGMRISYKWDG